MKAYLLTVPLLVSLIAGASGIQRVNHPDLTALAQTRVQEMAAGEYGGTHRYLGELDNGKWSSWGEVLGWNRYTATPEDSADMVVDGWMESPTHHSILVASQYDSIGCAVIEGEDTNFWYVCIFADHAGEVEIGLPATRDNTALALPDTAMETGR